MENQQHQAKSPNVSEVFPVHVSYQVPPLEELKRRFSGYIAPKIEQATFLPVEACKDVIREDGAIECRYLTTDGVGTKSEILKEIQRLGFRPALFEELIAFSETYPEALEGLDLIALGSMAEIEDESCVTSVWMHDKGKCLGISEVDYGWAPGERFLMVAKKG